jgi:hypothetical protein
MFFSFCPTLFSKYHAERLMSVCHFSGLQNLQSPPQMSLCLLSLSFPPSSQKTSKFRSKVCMSVCLCSRLQGFKMQEQGTCLFLSVPLSSQNSPSTFTCLFASALAFKSFSKYTLICICFFSVPSTSQKASTQSACLLASALAFARLPKSGR